MHGCPAQPEDENTSNNSSGGCCKDDRFFINGVLNLFLLFYLQEKKLYISIFKHFSLMICMFSSAVYFIDTHVR